MLAIFKKEMRSYFINPVGYVFTGVFLMIAALLCCFTTIISRSYDTSNYFTYLIVAFVILIPLLTMRLFAEERKLRTEQLLLTSPVTITGMVLGKYFASLALFSATLLVSCVNLIPVLSYASKERAGDPYKVSHIGPVAGEVVGRLIAVFLIGAAFIAIGAFISSLTENQLASAVITTAVLVFSVSVGLINRFISFYPVRFVIDWLSVLSRFANFSSGIFDISAVIYYLSLSFVFLFLTVRVYERRRLG